MILRKDTVESGNLAKPRLITDHLGSVRVTLKEDGSMDSWSDYYPFGKEARGSNTVNEPKEQFTGKERDYESGLDYFGARYYNSEVGRWTSRDPLAGKYPSLSPYNYVGNNPVSSFDPDGRDIIVLAHARRTDDPQASHPAGHQAVLIGNDKSGWTYLSYDYDKGENSGSGSNAENDIYTIAKFGSLEEFANSEHNTFKDDYDDGKGLETSHKGEDGEILQRYTDGYQIQTDETTDQKMISAGVKTFEKEYSLLTGNQCTAVAKNALNAGGLKNGEYSEDNYQGRGDLGNKPVSKNNLPITKHRTIAKNNKGTDVSNKLHRKEEEQ